MSPAQVAALLLHRHPVSSEAGPDGATIGLEGEEIGFPAAFVRRAALVERLTGLAAPALAVIVAPPGFGKSALLGEWAQRDFRPFIWLAVPSRSLAGDADRLLLENLSELPHSPCVVVLDDAHRLEARMLRAVVAAVLNVLPAGSTLAVSSRTELELPLGRLRAHRAVAEIRTAHLAMGGAETAELLQGAGLELDEEHVTALVSRTQGWPAALYLAALSARAAPAPAPAARAVRGDDLLLAQYLHDEVLSTLPPRLLCVARRSAILDELSGAPCDAVLMQRGSTLAISQLAQRTQLLHALDAGHTRYRWHPLLREALLAELRRVEPELESQLHTRASAWHSEHGDMDRAVEHACAAADRDRAGELLWPRIAEYMATGRRGLVARWLEGFRREEIVESAELAASAAHCALAAGDLEAAQRWALHARAALERTPGRGRSRLSAGLAVIDAAAANRGVAAMGDAAEHACDLEPVDSPWRPIGRALRGIAAYLGGDAAAAVTILEEAPGLGGQSVPAVTALSLSHRAMIAIQAKQWALASSLAAEAQEITWSRGLADEPVAALVLAASAATCAHDGRADEAKRDLRHGIELLATIGDSVSWYAAEVSILLACASLSLADVVGARTLLAQASRLARRTQGAVVFQEWFDAAWAQMDTLAETSLSGPSSLTIAELRILRFLPSHLSFREIADQLGVSANTVKTQAHAVYRKLGAASRSEAVARAHTAGLLGQ